MSTAHDYSDYLRDIIDNAQKARQFVSGMGYKAFAESVQTTYAVFYALEIIGEAARENTSHESAVSPGGFGHGEFLEISGPWKEGIPPCSTFLKAALQILI